MLNFYSTARSALLPAAVSMSLRNEAIRSVERLRIEQCMPRLWKAWSGWARPDSHLKTEFYGAVVPPVVDKVLVELDVARRHGRTPHAVYARFAQFITYMAKPQDNIAFATAVYSLSLAVGHGRKHRGRFWPLVHHVFEHFTKAMDTYLGSPAVVLLLRTISAFDTAPRALWTPFLLDQILLGGDALVASLGQKHQGHVRALILGAIQLAGQMGNALESISTKTAAVVQRLDLVGNVWNALVVYFGGDIAYLRKARKPVQAHSQQVLGEDVASALCIQELTRNESAAMAGVVLLKIMSRDALKPVAERLCEPAIIEDFLWDDFVHVAAQNYIVIIGGRCADLRQLFLTRFSAHSERGADWIHELFG